MQTESIKNSNDFDRPVVLLVDGHSLANRAFYGVPLLSNSQGQYTNALHGFFSILFKNLSMTGATALGVAFDQHAPTFRHQIYAAYKGTRSPMPEELRSQMEPLKQMLREAQVPLFYQDGYEADDIIGTLSKRYAGLGYMVYILSGDRDLLQLVDDSITVLLPKTKAGGSETEIYHPTEVKEKYGVSPDGFLQMKSLMGDSSDNIPGVPGIGEKTAADLIQKYDTLEGVLSHLGDISKPKLKSSLTEYEDQARLSLKLATIEIQASLSNPECVFEAADIQTMHFSDGPFWESLKRYELKSLMKLFSKGFVSDKALSLTESDSSHSAPQETESFAAQQIPAMPAIQTIANDDAFRLFVHQNKDVLEKGFSIEIQENTASEPYAMALCFDHGSALAYLKCGNNEAVQLALFADPPALSWRTVYDSLAPLLNNEFVPKCSFNSKTIYRAFLPFGLSLKGLTFDGVLAAYMINPTKGEYLPEDLAYAYLSFTMPDVQNDKEYLCATAYITEYLQKPLLEKIIAGGQDHLYLNCELPLTEVLADMELSGISVKSAFLSEYGVKLQKQMDLLEEAIYQKAGLRFNINSPKQLGEVLFDTLQLPGGKKTKNGYSTSADILEKLAVEYPIVSDILNYRQLSKLQGTYVEGMGSFIRPEDGKIHTRFNQTVTATGRLSSADPNLQNIPIRMEIGRELRKAFVPSGKEYFFMDADYSQIELRLLAHLSGDSNMREAFCSHADIHRQTAAQVLGKKPEEVTAEERSRAKAVNFGIIYGISAFSLSQDLGISRHEAEEYIQKYYAQYPDILGYLEKTVQSAKETGYAVTMFGRRRPMDELKESNFVRRSFGERVARNMPIQGSAADIIKWAMLGVYRRLKQEKLKSRILIQVHDELLLEVHRDEEEIVRHILQEEMSGVQSFAKDISVPLDIDIETGETWYEAK